MGLSRDRAWANGKSKQWTVFICITIEYFRHFVDYYYFGPANHYYSSRLNRCYAKPLDFIQIHSVKLNPSVISLIKDWWFFFYYYFRHNFIEFHSKRKLLKMVINCVKPILSSELCSIFAASKNCVDLPIDCFLSKQWMNPNRFLYARNSKFFVLIIGQWIKHHFSVCLSFSFISWYWAMAITIHRIYHNKIYDNLINCCISSIDNI